MISQKILNRPRQTFFASRPDLRLLSDLIDPHTSVLDLGCGDGTLLEYLVRQKSVKGRGIELSETGMLACVRRGLSVRQGNLEEGLADYPNESFDYVVLSQTLPYLDDPLMVLNEMLRVGERAVVSFPNWGYWRSRLEFLLTGRIPEAPFQPQKWYDTQRWQAFTITDFAQLCHQNGIRITQQAFLPSPHRMRWYRFKNFFATTAVFVLERPH
ncbi:MAG: methionine biosynthesis protein MetW [Ardenticatenaceae bacterium]